MKHTFKSISVYFDKDSNLIGVPSTEIKKWNALVDIDAIVNLTFPYSDDELEQFLENVFDLCYSLTPKELPKQSALQNYLEVKSYSASVKGLGLVSIKWIDKQGYTITPTWQNAKMKNAFGHLEDRAIGISDRYVKGELARSFRSVMNLSPIGSMNQKPEQKLYYD